MDNIKSAIAKNIVELRQQKGMTQLELAQKLNYSDKAVSKWERADSMPDVAVLVEVANLFQVSLDYLVSAEHSKKEVQETKKEKVTYSKKAIMAIAIVSVWLVAMLFFIILSSSAGRVGYSWICFIYAVPIQTIVWLVLNSIWFGGKGNYILISLLVWSILATIYITLRMCGIHMWLLFLLGIPGQLIVFICSIMKKNK